MWTKMDVSYHLHTTELNEICIEELGARNCLGIEASNNRLNCLKDY